MQLMYKIVIDFVPGRPGTEEFVPGFLLLLLFWDRWTMGRGNFIIPGQENFSCNLQFCTSFSLSTL